MPPDPPSKERLRRSLVRIINWSHPPVKNPGYGPVDNDVKVASTENIANLTLGCKNHTLFKTKMAEINTLFMTKTVRKPYLSGPHKPTAHTT